MKTMPLPLHNDIFLACKIPPVTEKLKSGQTLRRSLLVRSFNTSQHSQGS